MLDTPPEAAFDRIVRLAAALVGAPVAAVTLVDEHRQFIKGQVGLPEPLATVRQIPLSHSLCKHTVHGAEPLIIDDARAHPTYRHNGAVTELGVGAYVGVPVQDRDALTVATLCVFDTMPRIWSAKDLIVLRELSAAVAAEMELRATVRSLAGREARWRKMFGSVKLGVVVSSVTGRIAWANDAAGKLFGRATTELVGQPIHELRPTSWIGDGEEARRKEALARGDDVTFDEDIRRPDGTSASVRVHLTAMLDDDDAPEFTVAILEDVSVQKKAELLAAENHQRYRALVRALPNCAVWLFNQDREHLIVEGDAVLAAAGLTKAQVVGRRIEDVVSALNAERLVALYDDALVGRGRSVEVQRNGRWFALHSSPVRGLDGAISGGLLFLYDVTTRVENERMLEERTRTLQVLEHIAKASNMASSSSEALAAALALVCQHTGYELGHVLLADRAREVLYSSGIWYGSGAPPMRSFVERSASLTGERGQGMCGAVLETAEPLWVEEVVTAPVFLRRREAEEAGLRTGAMFPVFVGDHIVAVIELFSTERRPRHQGLLDMMASVGVQLGCVFERERQQATVAHRAMTDELTGLLNRRGFLEGGRELVRANRASGQELTLFFVDVDGLKQINDTLGHAAGDSAIRDTGELLRTSFRETDVVARLGGDEFVVLAKASPRAADALSARLAKALSAINTAPARSFALAMSIGTTAIDPNATSTLEEFVVIADAAMYELKRNRKKLRRIA